MERDGKAGLSASAGQQMEERVERWRKRWWGEGKSFQTAARKQPKKPSMGACTSVSVSTRWSPAPAASQQSSSEQQRAPARAHAAQAAVETAAHSACACTSALPQARREQHCIGNGPARTRTLRSHRTVHAHVAHCCNVAHCRPRQQLHPHHFNAQILHLGTQPLVVVVIS